ncbi:RNA/RNP complex-1-interacting phosphatase [Amyelois transitella]|uniref:RNA/RNP complex-1-interacting phosphatase n=1 Tax=Amyelois transitella TaxID=680683 RepID=UPI0029907BF8|nr:RNA/RNP complex-1-interacting phosphatase [Amyelois transitella]
MPPSIPDRWIPYKPCGNVINGTRIICFKVPLRKDVQVGNRDITEIWDVPALLQTVPNLGAVIDLTNTSRYYNPRELQAAGVLYKKILMPGRIIPPENKVYEFMDTIDEFLGKNRDFVVGVHCTHGLNRTGYMVCRYMRDRLHIAAKKAIKDFEKARGYQIERDNYIADLLGKTPPQPDIGNETTIRPHNDRRDSMTYRSPLAEYEHGESSRGYGKNSSRYGRSSRRDERRGSESSYDYKYDY